MVTVNYRVGVPERLGIDYETLRKYNPKIIYCQITGFGTEGPLKDRAGTDIVGSSPKEFGAAVKADIARMQRIVKKR